MKTKHTKGEWKATIGLSNNFINCGEKFITIIDKSDSFLNEGEHNANTKLIAAAPNQQEASILLYNLCRKLAGMLGHDSFNEIREDWNKAMNSHEQAIQKATE